MRKLQTNESRFQPDLVEDAELIKRLRAADECALELLMTRHRARVLSTTLRILRTHQEAEEVTQDVFLALWQHPDRFDAAKGQLITWLLIVARSRALDLLRHVKAKARRENELTNDQSAHDGSFWISRPDQDLMIHEAVSRLPAQQETVIRGAYFDGYALCEIAARQSVPLGTVKGRVRFALKRLRSELM
jgi:RNA polymerase sigma-70 factor, ECF subfamily